MTAPIEIDQRTRPRLGDVTVRSIRTLRGPNIYAYMPVIHAVIDIGVYDHHASDAFPGFVERLLEWLPGLEKHQCNLRRPGGFIERLKRGTYLAHITEHVTIELQNLMGFDVAYGRARGTGEDGVYNVTFAYREEMPARAAFELALKLILAAMHDEPFDIQAELASLFDLADEYRLGPSTEAIVNAARKRNIPIIRLTPTGSLVQLGYGVHQKRIQASETSNTSSIAVDLCQNKAMTNSMLRRVGVPVPEGRAVSTAEEAWEVAQSIGLPVVIKPEDGNQGKGVSVNLQTREEIITAFAIASQIRGGRVLVEQFIEGADYRLLVVNGKMIAAARRDPAQVLGDGTHTILELIEEVNRDPRRRDGHSSTMTRLKLDDVAKLVLSQQGLNPTSIPEAGKVVFLRNNSNLSTGGTAKDVTDIVHPANAQVAELAAQILALDVAGVDLVCLDITRPLNEQRGAIVEVNAAPGLRMHIAPAEGTPRDVGTPIVDMLFPPDQSHSIPIIAITGTNGKTTVTQLIGHIYETAHWMVGRTSTEGTFIGKERILQGDCSGPRSAQAVLLHPHVEVAILETARGGILREGLAFNTCTVGIVTNISNDHLGKDGVHTLADLAKVKQVVIENVAKDGAAVLNAEDPLVAEMAASTDARVVYFGLDPNHHVIAAHLAEGREAVYIENGYIVLANADVRFNLIELDRIPFTHSGKIRFQVQNALAAVAATWAAGVNPAMIARALTTFNPGENLAAGRFNILDFNGVEVIFDYGHNKGAIQALGEALAGLEKRRTCWIISLPDDRQDADLLATFEATFPYADEYILHDLHDNSRPAGSIQKLMAAHVPPGKPYEIVDTQEEAILLAWERLRPSDRLIITADDVDETQKVLDTLRQSDDGACQLE